MLSLPSDNLVSANVSNICFVKIVHCVCNISISVLTSELTAILFLDRSVTYNPLKVVTLLIPM